MPEIDINNLGAIGLVSDLPEMEVPPNAWSSGQNVRFYEGKVIAFPGHELAVAATPFNEIWAMRNVLSPIARYWVLVGQDTLGATKAYIYDGTDFTDITGAALTGTRSDIIVGDALNENYLITNGVDLPQYWDGAPANDLVVLPGWNANWRCGVLRAFKGFLVALDMTENGTRYPYRVRWSDETVPGGLPQNWDDTDPASLAGVQDLGVTTNFLVAGLPLRDTFLMYSEKEVLGMQLTGALSPVWRFYTISRQSGALNKRSVISSRGMHYALSDEDVVRTDGQSVQSIIDRKRRRWLFSQMDPSGLDYAYVFEQHHQDEVWVCFPTQGNTYPNVALVYNWKGDTWSVRDLPYKNMAAMEAYDIVGRDVLTWANHPYTWRSWPGKWNDSAHDNTDDEHFITEGVDSGGNAPIHRIERGNTFAGVSRKMRVEKLGLQLNGDDYAVVHEIYPRAKGGPATWWLGTQHVANGPVTWKKQRVFTPGVDKHISCKLSGRYFAVAIESEDVAGFEVSGFRVRYSARGSR